MCLHPAVHTTRFAHLVKPFRIVNEIVHGNLRSEGPTGESGLWYSAKFRKEPDTKILRALRIAAKSLLCSRPTNRFAERPNSAANGFILSRANRTLTFKFYRTFHQESSRPATLEIESDLTLKKSHAQETGHEWTLDFNHVARP